MFQVARDKCDIYFYPLICPWHDKLTFIQDKTNKYHIIHYARNAACYHSISHSCYVQSIYHIHCHYYIKVAITVSTWLAIIKHARFAFVCMLRFSEKLNKKYYAQPFTMFTVSVNIYNYIYISR